MHGGTMTTPELSSRRRRFLTPRWIALGVGAVVLLLGFAYWIGWIGSPGAVALDDGAGPPPTEVAPPFPDAKDGTPIRRLELADGEACAVLDEGDMEAVYRATFTAAPTENGCTYTANDVQVDVELMDVAHRDAYSVEAEGWPGYAEVVYEPYYALFMLDAERSALIVDAGDRAMILRARAARLDRLGHLERLKRLIARAAR
jgi:hypothetical protein